LLRANLSEFYRSRRIGGIQRLTGVNQLALNSKQMAGRERGNRSFCAMKAVSLVPDGQPADSLAKFGRIPADDC
jgi:hypothetical protein